MAGGGRGYASIASMRQTIGRHAYKGYSYLEGGSRVGAEVEAPHPPSLPHLLH